MVAWALRQRGVAERRTGTRSHDSAVGDERDDTDAMRRLGDVGAMQDVG